MSDGVTVTALRAGDEVVSGENWLGSLIAIKYLSTHTVALTGFAATLNTLLVRGVVMDSTLWAGVLQAGAGLLTGVLAVGSAVLVARKQNVILARQTELAAAALRSELFERRMDIYATATDFLIFLESYAKGGGEKEVAQLSVSVRESRFLFRPEVHDAMMEIWNQFQTFKIAKQDLTAGLVLYDTINPASVAEKLQIQISDVLKWRDGRLETLAEVFAPDLTIEADATKVAIR